MDWGKYPWYVEQRVENENAIQKSAEKKQQQKTRRIHSFLQWFARICARSSRYYAPQNQFYHTTSKTTTTKEI